MSMCNSLQIKISNILVEIYKKWASTYPSLKKINMQRKGDFVNGTGIINSMKEIYTNDVYT